MHPVLVAIAALLLDKHTAYFYENGVGAIGLPFQEGTDTSRVVHPVTLARMRKFMLSALGTGIAFRNPFITETKGTMCARLTDPLLRNAIARSVSCDEFPQRIAGCAQCGICPACLMRRVSLHYAHLSDVDRESHYRFDVTGRAHVLSEQRLYALHTMLYQVETFRQCLGQSGWEGLVIRFPELVTVADTIEQEEGVDHDGVVSLLATLYRGYIREWESFPYQLPSPNLALCG